MDKGIRWATLCKADQEYGTLRGAFIGYDDERDECTTDDKAGTGQHYRDA